MPADSAFAFQSRDPARAAMLERMLSKNTASYKYFWLKAILTLVERGRTEASFLELGALMAAHAWDPVIFFKLRLGATDQTGITIREAKARLGLDDYARLEDAAEAIASGASPEVAEQAEGLTRYVRRRFLSPCFEDILRTTPDARRDAAISRLSFAHPDAGPYQIDEKARMIRFSEGWVQFFRENLPLVKGWLDFRLAKYLQARNPSVPAVVNKLSRPEERNLTEAKKYWREAIRRGGVREIYSGSPFTEANFSRFGPLSIDHFIPWRFVLHDEMWNLTPMFRNSNSAKSDRLPDLDHFLEPLCRQQFEALSELRDSPFGRKALESFLAINEDADEELKAGTDRAFEAFSASLGRTVRPLFEIASSLGFATWDCAGHAPQASLF